MKNYSKIYYSHNNYSEIVSNVRFVRISLLSKLWAMFASIYICVRYFEDINKLFEKAFMSNRSLSRHMYIATVGHYDYDVRKH